MKCSECHGFGWFDGLEDDDEPIECMGCFGRGWMFFSDWLWHKWYWIKAPFSVWMEQLSHTRPGCWWWLHAGRNWRAWRLSRHIETEFQGHALTGHRINMLHRLIQASERVDLNCEQIIDKQRRMIWEATRATEMAAKRCASKAKGEGI